MIVTVKGRRVDLEVLLSRVLTAAAVISAGGSSLGIFHLPAKVVEVCGTLVTLYTFAAKSGLLPSGMIRPAGTK